RRPLLLPQGDETEVERSFRIVLAQRVDAPELALRLLVHSGLVEGDTEVAVLGRLVVGTRRRSSTSAYTHAHHVAGHEQTVQGLRCDELSEPGLCDECADIPLAIDERNELLLFRRQLALYRHHAVTIHGVHDVERRDLLRDQRPLIDATRALEEQRLRIYGMHGHAFVRSRAGFEVERALRPCEEQIDRFFGAEIPVDDRRVRDRAVGEVDVSEVVGVRQAEAAGLLPHREELKHVRETRLGEASADRHQRNSSMILPDSSGHTRTTFSSSLNAAGVSALCRARSSSTRCATTAWRPARKSSSSAVSSAMTTQIQLHHVKQP